MTPVEVVRAAFAAYRAQDRAAAERLYASDFRFDSPQDDHIDRAAWFERCFPTAGRFTSQDILLLAPVDTEIGAHVVVLYEYALTDGSRWRNTEVITVRGGQITETQVYFGRRRS